MVAPHNALFAMPVPTVKPLVSPLLRVFAKMAITVQLVRQLQDLKRTCALQEICAWLAQLTLSSTRMPLTAQVAHINTKTDSPLALIAQ